MENKELTLEEIQQGSFEILKKVKEIFDKNSWKYYLAYGTLIGAIRHKGFIPWDDDIDIWVPRKDYEAFIQFCKDNKENLKPFELIHYSTNEKYIYPIARFSDSRYSIKYRNTKDYGLGLFVDVYPLDGIDNNDMKYINKIIRMDKEITMLGSIKFIPSKNILKNIIKIPYFYFVKMKNLNKLLEKVDNYSQKYDFENSQYFNCVNWEIIGKKIRERKLLDGGNNLECFKEFNGEMFRVPYEYDKVLKSSYGDYMKLPPEEERIAHHYYKAYRK